MSGSAGGDVQPDQRFAGARDSGDEDDGFLPLRTSPLDDFLDRNRSDRKILSFGFAARDRLH